jgi:beta-N-acetylhexosaminidase
VGTPPTGTVSLARMVGQTLVGRFAGSAPSASFLAEIEAGRLGGVILFANNVAQGALATRHLDDRLQRAAREGGNPPLLIMTDQEGGEVRRLAWAPPTLAPAKMTSSALSRAEGEATGEALRSVGINVDLAPVADVVHVVDSFLGTRSFGSDPAIVAERACSFAAGLAGQGVAFTLKHFPGLGRALASTDLQPTVVDASAKALRGDYAPYLGCASNADALVMVSSAGYPSLTGSTAPAVLSSEIYTRELPIAVGEEPVTISDDLQAAALARERTPGQRALSAGLDLLLYAQSSEASRYAFQRLLFVAEHGGIVRSRLEQAYRAILDIKARVAGATNAGPATATQSPQQESSSYPESIGAPETVKPEVGSPAEASPSG